MAFNMTKEQFDSVFGVSSEDIGRSENVADNDQQGSQENSYWHDILEYMYSSHMEMLKTLAAWHSKGGTFSVFTCRNDYVEAISMGMYDKKVPFMLVEADNGRYGIIFCEKDTTVVISIINNSLYRKSVECDIMTSSQLAADILRTTKDNRKKKVFVLAGMNQREADYLEKLCRNRISGIRLGANRMKDDSFIMAVPSIYADILPDKHESTKLQQIFVETMIHTEDDVGQKEIIMREDTALTREQIVTGNYDEYPVYICGTGMNYILCRKNGEYERCYGVEVPGGIELITDKKITIEGCLQELSGIPEDHDLMAAIEGKIDKKDIDEALMLLEEDESLDLLTALRKIDYRRRIRSEFTSLVVPAYMHTEEEVLQYLSENSSRWKEMRAVLQEKTLVEEADRMVYGKIKKDRVLYNDGQTQSKTKLYAAEMAKILKGISIGRCPKGYSPQKMKALISMCHKNSINVEQLGRAGNKLKNMECYEIEADRMIVRQNVDKVLSDIKGARDSEEREHNIQKEYREQEEYYR